MLCFSCLVNLIVDIYSILIFVSVLSAFNSEPTELERQRENVSLRLKKAFGLSVDDESRKPGKFIL